MNKLIKKNFLFFMFLFASGAVSIALIVVALMKHSEYEENYKSLETLKGQIKSLTSQKPSPSQQNVEIINKDTEMMQALASSMEQRFGHPYTPALQAFVDVLNEKMSATPPPAKAATSEDASEDGNEETVEAKAPFKVTVNDLMREFRTFWEVERGKENMPVQILPMFKQTQGWVQNDENGDSVKVYWNNETWDEALKAFGKVASDISFEEISQKNIESIFMSTMGIARTFDSGDSGFPFFEKELRTRLANLCNQNDIGLASGGNTFKIDVYTPKNEMGPMSFQMMMGAGNMREAMEAASAGESTKKTDETEQQAYDARSWEVIGDMVKRISASGIDSIDDFAATTREGMEDGGYRYYRFQFEVTGHLESIRNVCDLLNDAWKDNRIYIIRTMNIEKLDDGAQGIIDAAQKLREQALNEASTSSYGYGYNDQGGNRNNPAMMMMGGGAGMAMNRSEGGGSNINADSVPGQRLKARSNSDSGGGNAMAMMMGGGGSSSGNRRQGVQKYLWDERVSYWQSLLEPDHSEDAVAYYARKNYGMPIIGGNMRMRAMFVVQYVCFENGDMLK